MKHIGAIPFLVLSFLLFSTPAFFQLSFSGSSQKNEQTKQNIGRKLASTEVSEPSSKGECESRTLRVRTCSGDDKKSCQTYQEQTYLRCKH